MIVRQSIVRLATLVALGGSVLASNPATAQSEAEQDLLYAALCVGIVWPAGSETRVAGSVDTAALDLRLRSDALMAAANRAAPALSARLAQEAADGADWRRKAVARVPGVVASVEAECLLFLDSYLPPLH